MGIVVGRDVGRDTAIFRPDRSVLIATEPTNRSNTLVLRRTADGTDQIIMENGSVRLRMTLDDTKTKLNFRVYKGIVPGTDCDLKIVAHLKKKFQHVFYLYAVSEFAGVYTCE